MQTADYQSSSQMSNAAARLSPKVARCCGNFLAGLNGCAGLPFKKVAGVGAAAVDDLPQTGQRVSRQKEQSPLLVLPDVRMFVRSQDAQHCLVNSYDGMAQRHGAKAYLLWQSGDDAAKPAAVKLGHARHETQPAAQAEHNQPGSQAQQRVGRGP